MVGSKRYTVGKFARLFGLSRSTLLYYDKIGLLAPGDYSAAGYRLYTEVERKRMQAIQQFRDAGIPLNEIADLLEQAPCKLADRLELRLNEINTDISRLRYQQRVIVSLLKQKSLYRRTRVMTKKKWTALLRATGLDEAGMRRWHREFEAMSPEAHQDFLESLGIDAEEIRTIRDWSAMTG